MITKNTKLPLSVVIVVVSSIARGIWTTATLWPEYKVLQDKVFAIKPYDDSWVRAHTQYSLTYYNSKIAALEAEIENLKTRTR